MIVTFLPNKYQVWYTQLIVKAVVREMVGHLPTLYHKHHVLPKSLGGFDTKNNIVNLTLREHFLAHWLLTKFTEGLALIKMKNALCMMGNSGFIVSGWRYELAGRARRNCVVSEETRRKISLSNRGRKHTAEAKLKIGVSSATRVRSKEHGQRISAAKKGYHHTSEARLKMSLSKIGKPGHAPSIENIQKLIQRSKDRKGYKHSDETRRRMRFGNALYRMKRCQVASKNDLIYV